MELPLSCFGLKRNFCSLCVLKKSSFPLFHSTKLTSSDIGSKSACSALFVVSNILRQFLVLFRPRSKRCKAKRITRSKTCSHRSLYWFFIRSNLMQNPCANRLGRPSSISCECIPQMEAPEKPVRKPIFFVCEASCASFCPCLLFLSIYRVMV